MKTIVAYILILNYAVCALLGHTGLHVVVGDNACPHNHNFSHVSLEQAYHVHSGECEHSSKQHSKCRHHRHSNGEESKIVNNDISDSEVHTNWYQLLLEEQQLSSKHNKHVPDGDHDDYGCVVHQVLSQDADFPLAIPLELFECRNLARLNTTTLLIDKCFCYQGLARGPPSLS